MIAENATAVAIVKKVSDHRRGEGWPPHIVKLGTF